MRLRHLMATGCIAAMGFAATMPMAHAADHRGGTMHIVGTTAGGTLDPQINYTQQVWQLYQQAYDGLLAFHKTGGKAGNDIVPDLAEAMPTMQDGGKTYIFKLRKGVHFSNGKEVTVADVVASFQRLFKVSSPTAGSFYNVIVGSDACLKTPATCTLDGGVVGDDKAGTITFHLTQPDSEFFDKLSIPHASILPADTPAKDMGDEPIPGTGAYMFTSYDPKKELVMERNPHFKQWSAAAQPDGYPDKVSYTFGLTDEAEVTAVENHQADWMFDTPPADRLNEVGTKFASQVHVTQMAAFFYLAMNTNLAPFDNPKVRQAVNYALDRKALVNVYGGRLTGQPTCQILPPGFQGYEWYCPYQKTAGKTYSGPDMAKAKELIKESGVKPGMDVTLISEDSTVWKNMAGYVQSVLQQLGFNAHLKTLSHDIEFTYIQNTNNKMQIALTQWYQDYPAPSDFLYVLYGCASFHQGSDASPNIAGFCDKGIDAEMQKAMLTAVSDPKAANAMWTKIDREVTDAGPAAPLFNPKQIDFVSTRLGHYVFNPVFLFIPTQAWVQ